MYENKAVKKMGEEKEEEKTLINARLVKTIDAWRVMSKREMIERNAEFRKDKEPYIFIEEEASE